MKPTSLPTVPTQSLSTSSRIESTLYHTGIKMASIGGGILAGTIGMSFLGVVAMAALPALISPVMTHFLTLIIAGTATGCATALAGGQLSKVYETHKKGKLLPHQQGGITGKAVMGATVLGFACSGVTYMCMPKNPTESEKTSHYKTGSLPPESRLTKIFTASPAKDQVSPPLMKASSPQNLERLDIR